MKGSKVENKIGFFKRLFLSITDFESYQKFAMEKTKTAVFYLFKLILLFSVIITMVMLYIFTTSFQGAKKYIETDLPEFVYENNTLSIVEESVLLEDEKSIPQIVIIDTNIKNDMENIEKISLNKFGVGVFAQRIVVNANGLNLQYSYVELGEILNIQTLNKQELITKLNNTNYTAILIALFVLITIALFILYLGWILLDAIVIALLGHIMSKIYVINLRFSSALNISLHSLSLPIILNIIYIIINLLTGFTMKYFDAMYTSITCIYAITALLIIKTNLIKKQIELQKILEDTINEQDILETKPERKEEPKEKEKNEKDDKKEGKKKKTKGEAEEGGIA